jgi:hypothetical protein
MAVIARLRLHGNEGNREIEWQKLLQGVANNRPELIEEWRDVGASRKKRIFREKFGDYGDELRWAGFGAINIGTLSRETIERFAIKLGKAFYYLHTGQILDGSIYLAIVDYHSARRRRPEQMEEMLRFAPVLADLQRNKRQLSDQFIYRFNADRDLGVMYAVVEIGRQLLLQIFALRYDTAERLESDMELPTPRKGVFSCRLQSHPARLAE